MRRTFIKTAILAITVPMCPLTFAQSGKTIRIVVPFGAGAVQDTLARTINVELGQALGANVIVENRAGG